MTVAWLRPRPASAPDPLDDTAPLIDQLRAVHRIDIIDESQAHDLVWRHARQPYDLLVHELADSPAHRFVAPYAIHYPGVLMLRGFAPRYTRALLASRSVVVADDAVAAALGETHPGMDVRVAPAGIGDWASTTARHDGPTRFGVLDPRRIDVVQRAAQRTRDAGRPVEVIAGDPARVLRDADVIVALDWPPPAGPPGAALAGMSAARPVVAFETLVTAAWPCLDPQTWQPRGYGGTTGTGSQGASGPIAISIDPRDEEHSLMLAMKRLSADAALRAGLGAAGRTWWREHATIAHAFQAWHRILDLPGLPPQPAFAGADGSEHARAVLAEFGVEVDFL